MNSISVPLNASREVQEKATSEMLRFINVAGSISDWGLLQARTLFESAHAWAKEGIIPLAKWQAKFHLSKVRATSRSEQVFKDYLRVNDFEEIAGNAL